MSTVALRGAIADSAGMQGLGLPLGRTHDMRSFNATSAKRTSAVTEPHTLPGEESPSHLSFQLLPVLAYFAHYPPGGCERLALVVFTGTVGASPRLFYLASAGVV